VEFCNLSVFMNRNSHVVLAFNVLSSHSFAWRVGFVFEAFLTLCNHPMRSMTSKSVHIGALFSRWVFVFYFSFFSTINVSLQTQTTLLSSNSIAPSDRHRFLNQLGMRLLIGLFWSHVQMKCYGKAELELSMYLRWAGIYNIHLSFSKSK